MDNIQYVEVVYSNVPFSYSRPSLPSFNVVNKSSINHIAPQKVSKIKILGLGQEQIYEF